MPPTIGPSTVDKIKNSLALSAHVSGKTHDFYRYPARFHPTVAHDLILSFSSRGDYVLDPFMGGGTSVVEAIALGRLAIGTDVNSLAHFLTEARTTPLSAADETAIWSWARRTSHALQQDDLSRAPSVGIPNLPVDAEQSFSTALSLTEGMLPRRMRFARAVLLQLGQTTLDCQRHGWVGRSELAGMFDNVVSRMLSGLDDFVRTCNEIDVPKNKITARRRLYCMAAIELERLEIFRTSKIRPRLILTSPPYPGVHVLYHRWQYRGRKETPAPYWIADVVDGNSGSHYCGGSRTQTGIRRYFRMITEAFSSIRRIMDPNGIVVQLIGFSHIESQLPAYLRAMEQAGFREVLMSENDDQPVGRTVPNRKWYAATKGVTDSCSEFLIAHILK